MAEPMDLDVPRGKKRKADEVEDSNSPGRIRALDPDVINKIAAGEIIVAPVHALKEVMENAVDAGSTALEVLVKEGGLKLLQITDNGSGIDKEDLAILCERFTTSKLEKFEDLMSIGTYGFRGEALASISHIAHLTVTTKTKDSNCAWRAFYEGGKLAPSKPGQSPDPKPVAGRQGTQIMVQDLFYNVPTRRRAFRSAADEYNKIIDMVGRYAIHCRNVAFSCKKHGESSTSIAIQNSASVLDRIRQIYGAGLAKELVDFSTSDDRWAFKADGMATNANYSIKKTSLLLFINNRCVESSKIRKAMEQTYSTFLPKGGHPFVYLSLQIDPRRVDVNVHPTKREVNFLNEDEITQAICEHICSRLAAVDSSRTFLTQTLLPGGAWTALESQPDGARTQCTAGKSKNGRGPSRDDAKLVRTDTAMRKITSMLAPAITGCGEPGPTRAGSKDGDAIEYETTDREPTACRLASIKELRALVRDNIHHELTDMFANHSFVGIVDERRRLAAVQGGVKLFLVDYGRACFEYLYQVGLTDFANFGTIAFSPPLDLRALLRVAAEQEKQASACASRTSDESLGPDMEMDVTEAVELVARQLLERREMLLEYFSLEITAAAELRAVPLLVRGYTPAMVKLPRFLLRLGPHVDWTEEKACFDSFLRELATFYVPERLPATEPEPGPGPGLGPEPSAEQKKAAISEELKARQTHVRRALEHVFFPAFKTRLLATKTLMRGGVLEVANLKGLYRVFERC